MSEAASMLSALGAHIKGAMPEAVTSAQVRFDELTLVVNAAEIVAVVTFLRDDPECLFVNLIDITGVDYPSRMPRFDVVWHLLSPRHNRRIRLKAAVGEDEPAPSLVDVFPSANWYERETYDMFGIVFSGHPDLRRLLTDYGFDGHPLRKDFPMSGYVEVRWDDAQKRVVYEPVRLMQEYRNFDFLSPWEGGVPQRLPGDEKAGEG